MAGKKKVFIAEDDEIALASLKRLLVLSGYDVEATRSPKEVVTMIKALRPDVILLDLMMPELGGFDICELLNRDRQTQGIPIIITSALADDADIKKAYKLGVVGYFFKPYDFKELLREINKAISSKETGPDA